MSDLKMKRKELLETARELLAKADMTADDLKRVESIKGEVEQISARLKAAGEFAAFADSLDGDADTPPAEPVAAKSLGEHFMRTVGAKFKAARGVSGATVAAPEFKANTDTAMRPEGRELVTSDVVDGFVQAPRDRLMLTDVLGTYTLSGNTVTYWEEPTIEGQFTTVAEGAGKPQLHPTNPVKRTESLVKIAGFWTVTDEMLEDEAYLVSAINNLLSYKFLLAEESAFLNGASGSGGIVGLLNRERVQTISQGSDTLADVIFKAMTNVQVGSALTADAVVINPADWQTLRLSKDSNGQYYGGGVFMGPYGNGGVPVEPNPWGIKPVITSQIAKGTALVGNFKLGAQKAFKGGLRVESTNSHGTNFTDNLTTFRLERRSLLMVPSPTAFVKVTLAEA